MWKVTLRGITTKKLRFLLTASSVMLGVAFMSGTMTLTDTVRATFDDLFRDINEGTDVVVRGVQPFESDFGDVPRRPVPAALLPAVREVPGVATAEGLVEVPYAQIVDEANEPVGNPGLGAPSFGFSWTDDEDLNPMTLQPGGHAPAAADEVVIDKGSADAGGIAVGDTVRVLTQQEVKEYEVVGIAKFGAADSPAGASIVMFTTEEAQRINNFRDQYSSIAVVGDGSVSQQELAERIARSALVGSDVEIVTGEALIEENQDQLAENIGFFNTALLVFAFVALFVACFIIYNTFQITVAQRTRELALLRAIGASAAQVRRSVIAEALAVGLAASALGLGLGILLSVVLKNLLNTLGFDIPATDVVVTPDTVVWAFVVGLLVTVLSAVLPARRAARVPPVAAMRDVAVERPTNFGRRLLIGGAILALGAAVLVYGLFATPDDAVAFIGFGAFTVFIGVFVLGPLIVRPVARVLGRPLVLVKGVTGTLARENAVRNPRRTAATAAALMVGVALVGFITIFAASAKKSIAHAIDQQLKSDFLVQGGTGFAMVPLSPTVAETMRTVPELSVVAPVRFDAVLVGGEQAFVTGADPATSSELVDFDVREGSLRDLTADGIAVSERYADDNDLGMGDLVVVTFPATGDVPMEIEAIYSRREMAGDFLITLDAWATNFLPQQQYDSLVMARLAPGADADAARAAIEEALEPYPTAKVRDNAQYKEDQAASVNQVVNLVYALLFLAIVIATIGIVITLMLSIYERTRELGLLRAVGMTQSQMRSSVRWESVIIALLGTALGLVIGLFFGWAVVAALRDEGFTRFAAAPGQLLVIVVVAAVVGVVAGVYPAWRASRLDVLRAIATE
ncbi:MAG: ABC transporter substrate-binding protein [Acidimicrobiia bacterium]|nr:MAG: ABC transporter substrate-binding protein [Acidimicrobiia bacterium]